jgi:hypothetical protein
MDWKVLPHGPVTPLEENLWTVTGSFDIPFNPLKRVMTIVRRSDGKLVLHGLMALDEKTQAEVEALGEIAYLVVPSGFHRLDAGRYRERYPNARMFAPAAARGRVEKVAKIDATYEAYEPDDTTSLVDVDGLAKREGALVVKSKRGTTYVMNDALFNMPEHQSGVSGFVLKHVTQSTGGPKVSRTARIGLVADSMAYRAALEKIASTDDLVRVIVAHHVPIEENVGDALRKAASDL